MREQLCFPGAMAADLSPVAVQMQTPSRYGESKVIIRWVRYAFAILLFISSLRSAPQGAPGAKPTWSNGNKVGVGTSTTENSRVWFTLGRNGALNEVYYPAIDSANTRTLELIRNTDSRSGASVNGQPPRDQASTCCPKLQAHSHERKTSGGDARTRLVRQYPQGECCDGDA